MADARWRRTRESIEQLQRVGADPSSPYPPFTLVFVWQHDWRHQCLEDPTIKAFLNRFYESWPTEPMRPRDSFFGGR